MPIVSVVIPTRDRPEWLQEAVESVLAQTMADLEVVIVLNGASVAAAAAANRLAADPRVKVVEMAAVTVPAARNRGMAVAGENGSASSTTTIFGCRTSWRPNLPPPGRRGQGS
jgi:glycosyltransferase involved in cell wall biosynthesis